MTAAATQRPVHLDVQQTCGVCRALAEPRRHRKQPLRQRQRTGHYKKINTESLKFRNDVGEHQKRQLVQSSDVKWQPDNR